MLNIDIGIRYVVPEWQSGTYLYEITSYKVYDLRSICDSIFDSAKKHLHKFLRSCNGKFAQDVLELGVTFLQVPNDMFTRHVRTGYKHFISLIGGMYPSQGIIRLNFDK